MHAGEVDSDPARTKRKQRSTSPRRRIAFLGIGLILAVASAEVLVASFLVSDGRYGERPLPPYGAINTPWQKELFTRRSRLWTEGKADQGYTVFDPDLGWTLFPSRESEGGRTNALAARGPREYPAEPEAGVSRILTFGDSFTYCYLSANQETWQVQTEAARPDLEVINFGVPSYGTDQALLRFRSLGRNLGARIIVLGLMLENIGRNVNRYRPIYFAQSGTLACKPRFVLEGETLKLLPLPFADEGEALAAIGDGSILDLLGDHEYWRNRPTVPFGKSLASFRLAGGFFAYLQRRPQALWESIDEEPYQVTMAILQAFAAEARAAGAEHSPILIFPTQDDVDALLAGSSRYWQPMLADLEQRGLDSLDVSIPLAEECRSSNEGSEAVFAGGHLNARGNRVVAEELLTWLASKR